MQMNNGEADMAEPDMVGDAPVITIIEPTDGEMVSNDVSFASTAVDPEDGDISANMGWTSNIDGSIGFGGTFTSTLSVGTHTITASVFDSDGNQTVQRFSITVTD
jgi:hypothetical protein